MEEKDKKRDTTYTCKKCGKTYYSRTALPNHFFSAHKLSTSQYKGRYKELVTENNKEEGKMNTIVINEKFEPDKFTPEEVKVETKEYNKESEEVKVETKEYKEDYTEDEEELVVE